MEAMLESIRHRGPDDRGSFEDKDVSLGHVRLSILDLSEAGHQPMQFENLVLVFNGEVYNFKEIRETLEGEYTFHSDTDSEVVLKAIHKWGLEAVTRFVGMFAFALYDKLEAKLYLVRDRVGVKPLYYYEDRDRGEFAFASEPRAITRFAPHLDVEERALSEFFEYGFISSGLSIYRKCHKVPPGHILTYDLHQKRYYVNQYWSLERFYEMPKLDMDETTLIDTLEELLIESFKYRMVSDVPVGVFLSGGIDSSIVTAILQKHYGTINTFTIGFKEAGYNEAEWAKKVASHLGTSHTERYLTAADAEDVLSHFVDIYDEPFGDSSGIPTTLVSQVAKENGMKVVLSADGGDELFAGYERYWSAYNIGKYVFLMPAPLRRMLRGIWEMGGPQIFSKLFHMRNFTQRFNQVSQMLQATSWRSFYEKTLSNMRPEEMEALLGRQFFSNEEKAFSTGLQFHPIEGMMLWDYHRYLPDDILVKVDRATMYHSIEGRDPLLDHRIAEFMARVPFEYKYRPGKSKYLLRKILGRYLPQSLIERPKMGFSIPMFEWFAADLRKLFDQYFQGDDPVVNMDFVRSYYQKLKAGEPVNINLLWFALVYRMWRQRYLKGGKESGAKSV